jgi:hypothetical protein
MFCELNDELMYDKAGGIRSYHRIVLLNLSYGIDLFVYLMIVIAGHLTLLSDKMA